MRKINNQYGLFEIPKKYVLAKDIEFEIKSNGFKLVPLLISKGKIEWIPSNNSVKKSRLTWEWFADLMETEGRIELIKK